MPSLKRSVADAVGRLVGARIVPPHRVGALAEEEHIRRLIAAYDIDCIFDVGANAGQYARMLRERVGYTGTIISYEPIPVLATEMRNAAHDLGPWFIQEMALDKAPGRARFKVTQDSQFSSLRSASDLGKEVFAHQIGVSEEIEVVTGTMAQEFQIWRAKLGFNRPYLKMDTQGNDLAVAEGAGDFLREFVAVQSEIAVRKLYDDIPDISDSIAYFRQAGFEVSAFVSNNEGHFPILLETDCIFINRLFT
jgi:FkbM family methyltransferase